MLKIFGLVITFYPTQDIIDNINSYLPHISELLIVDNTPEQSEVFKELSEKIIDKDCISVIFNHKNQGIAFALNQGAQIALNKNYNWMLTMDQDSSFSDSLFFERFLATNKTNLAIFAPGNRATNKTDREMKEIDDVTIVMTSGNILNLDAWKDVNGFNNKLFIDEVDHDFCLRLKLKSYLILQYNNALLNHSLGKSKLIKFFGGRKELFLHNPVRTYYIVRNNFYMFKTYANQFPKTIKLRKKVLIVDLLKILLYSDKKITHFRNAYKGFRDYKRDKFGEY